MHDIKNLLSKVTQVRTLTLNEQHNVLATCLVQTLRDIRGTTKSHAGEIGVEYGSAPTHTHTITYSMPLMPIHLSHQMEGTTIAGALINVAEHVFANTLNADGTEHNKVGEEFRSRLIASGENQEIARALRTIFGILSLSNSVNAEPLARVNVTMDMYVYAMGRFPEFKVLFEVQRPVETEVPNPPYFCARVVVRPE